MIRALDIDGHAVAVAEAGSGAPLVYLHGFADIHGSNGDWLPFHRALAARIRVLAPAHPGCGTSEENEEIDSIEDVVFHYLQLFDALDIGEFHLAGASIGGWIAAEVAIRIPERVRSLAAAKGCSPAQLALAWVLGQGADVVPIPGTKRRRYLEENLGAVGVSFTPDELRRIDEISPRGAAAGERYPPVMMAFVNG